MEGRCTQESKKLEFSSRKTRPYTHNSHARKLFANRSGNMSHMNVGLIPFASLNLEINFFFCENFRLKLNQTGDSYLGERF
jgi:hypothetical protein